VSGREPSRGTTVDLPVVVGAGRELHRDPLAGLEGDLVTGVLQRVSVVDGWAHVGLGELDVISGTA
jgi:hypothetical protein